MFCEIRPLDSFDHYIYVVVLSRHQGKLLLSRHRARATWETQGGHIEPGETPAQAAARELFEESGATDFALTPLCDYIAGDETNASAGVVFVADIHTLAPLPQSEMAEVRLFDALPQNITYPGITPHLYAEAARQGHFPHGKEISPMSDCIRPAGSCETYKYALILSEYQGKLLLSRHRARATWETQGGHIEPGETPAQAAARELFEESGATDFALTPLCDFVAPDGNSGVTAAGMVFVAHIRALSELPESEMAEVRLFDALPQNITYPGIAPKLYAEARRQGFFSNNR